MRMKKYMTMSGKVRYAVFDPSGNLMRDAMTKRQADAYRKRKRKEQPWLGR